ncbi:hypothetical protein D3C80_1783310 [compost metagenome]
MQITAQGILVDAREGLEPGTGLAAQVIAGEQRQEQMAAAQACFAEVDRGAKPGGFEQRWQLRR